MNANLTYVETPKENLHPFERSGNGVGPFRFVGFYALPSKTLAEANPDAYNAALREAPKLTRGLGTCSHCGMAIMNVCIIESADGKRFGVGTDCVEKTGDAFLGDKAKIALRRHQRELRAAKAEERRRQWFEAHKAGVDAANAQREADRQEEQRLRIHLVMGRWSFVLPALDAAGPWAQSVAAGIRDGIQPLGRGVQIVRDIYRKSFPRGEQAAALENFDSRIP